MIFTGYSQFQRSDIEFIKDKDKTYIIKFKDGTAFKQITTFEQVYSLSRETDSRICSYGAWFVSDKDSLFLTLEDLNDLNKNNEISLG